MPVFRVEPHENIVWLHLHPTHFIRHVHPPLLLEELGCTELGPVVWHVIEHVEEDSVGKGVDSGLRKPLWLAHVVTLRNADVYLEAVTVVCQVLAPFWVCTPTASLRGTWGRRRWRVLQCWRFLGHEALGVQLVVSEGGLGREHCRSRRERRHKSVCQVPRNDEARRVRRCSVL